MNIPEFPLLPEIPDKKQQDAATKLSKTYRGNKVRKEFNKNLSQTILELHEQFATSYGQIIRRYPNRAELLQHLLFQADMKELQPLREKIIKLSKLYLSSAKYKKSNSINIESLYQMNRSEIVSAAKKHLQGLGKLSLVDFQVNENEKRTEVYVREVSRYFDRRIA